MANLLVFDTSTDWCSVAVLKGDVLFEQQQLQPRKHAQLLLPMIDAVLAKAELKASDLSGIAFGIGPGSFTGLRISISIAQGICLAQDLPAYGIPTFQALAWEAHEQGVGDRLVTCLNAHMGEVFLAAYQVKDGEMYETVAPCLKKPTDIEWNDLPCDEGYIAVGDGFALDPVIESFSGSAFHTSVHTAIAPKASSMVQLAKQAFIRGQFAAVETQQPVYLRDTVAWKKLSEQPSLLKKP